MSENKKKIAIVSGSRADFGLLRPLCYFFETQKSVELWVIATGSHFSKRHGYTFNDIVSANFSNVFRMNLHIEGDAAGDINNYIARSITRTNEFLAAHRIDSLIVLGDRYEILGVCIAAAIHGIEISHIHGGEVTTGAFDEFIRHSITKMSSLHFTAHPEYSKRVIQLGEDPQTVFFVGGLGAEIVKDLRPKLLSKEDCEEKLNLKFKKKNLLVTFHPETNKSEGTRSDFLTLLKVLDKCDDICCIFSLPNADTGFKFFIQAVKEFVKFRNQSSYYYFSLGHLRYLSLMQFVDAVIGNSSSGILEVPSFQIPTINIGSRQDGRVRSISVIDTDTSEKGISEAIAKAYSPAFKESIENCENPFFKQGTVREIGRIILSQDFESRPKRFFDVSFTS